MSTLALHGLRKVFDDGTVAVEALDLAIDDGEFLAIVGPSGCGKTTVLRMVAGLEEPTAGEIRIDDEVVTHQSAQQRDVAMAFQQHALYPHMTVRENIGFPLRMAGLHRSEVRRRVDAMAKTLGLGEVLERTPRRLSGGQQQRVSMGRAMIRNPRLFLMDEPMSNLDAGLRTATRVEIMKIQQRLQATTLYVTHDQVEAMSMADRVVVMRQGRIVQMGAPLDLYRCPVDVFVAQFMGAPPMSIVPARIRACATAHHGHELVIGPYSVPLPAAGDLAGLAGTEIAVGLRPEAFRRCVNGPISASVERTEQIGSEQLVHATIDCPGIDVVGHEAVNDSSARASIRLYVGAEETVSLWEPLRLDLDLRETHVFDSATGHRIGDLTGDGISCPSPTATPGGASGGPSLQ